MTVLETLIVLTFFGAVGSLVTLAVSAKARARAKAALGFAPPGPPPVVAPSPAEGPRGARETSRRHAAELRVAAGRWLFKHATSACPTVSDLVSDQLVDPSLAAGDAWGSPFLLSCVGEEVFVKSAGPDHVLSTDDDVVEPEGAPVPKHEPPPPPLPPPPPPDPFPVIETWWSDGYPPFEAGMTRPRRLSGPDPAYPPEALAARVEGKVLAKCLITTKGTLRGCRIIKGLPYTDEAVLKALAAQRYAPATRQGRPVEVGYVLPFDFKLP